METKKKVVAVVLFLLFAGGITAVILLLSSKKSQEKEKKENNITIDAYGLGSWYKAVKVPPLIKEIKATWDGCKDACVSDNSCKAFTRFRTTDTYHPGGRPCQLFSQNFPQSEVRSAVGGGWEGELANIVGR